MNVDFDWTPKGAAFTYTIAGTTFPPAGARFATYRTPVKSLITFTATAEPPQGVTVLEYRWDLGDGAVAFGPTVGHTFAIPNPALSVRLRVTGSDGQQASLSKVLHLEEMFVTTVSGRVRV